MPINNKMWLPLFLAMWIFSVATNAMADETEDAKALYNKGKEHFSNEQYEEALAAFTEAYNLSEKTDLLFNLGICAEKLGQLDRAVAYYEVYLEEKPDAPDAAQVTARMEKLQKQIDAPEPAPKEPPVEPAEQSNEEPAQPPQPALPMEPLFESDQLEEDEKPAGPVWPKIAIGVGGLVLAGGTITAIMAYKEYDHLKNTCSPQCSDVQIKKSKAISVVADIQFGLGAAAVTAGIIGALVLRNKEKPARQTDETVVWRALPGIGPSGTGLIIEGSF